MRVAAGLLAVTFFQAALAQEFGMHELATTFALVYTGIAFWMVRQVLKW